MPNILIFFATSNLWLSHILSPFDYLIIQWCNIWKTLSFVNTHRDTINYGCQCDCRCPQWERAPPFLQSRGNSCQDTYLLYINLFLILIQILSWFRFYTPRPNHSFILFFHLIFSPTLNCGMVEKGFFCWAGSILARIRIISCVYIFLILTLIFHPNSDWWI